MWQVACEEHVHVSEIVGLVDLTRAHVLLQLLTGPVAVTPQMLALAAATLPVLIC